MDLVFDYQHMWWISAIFPQKTTLWINTEWSWSREWATSSRFWMSSWKKKLSSRKVMTESELCRPLRKRWGNSTAVPWKLAVPPKMSSTKSFRHTRDSFLMTSAERTFAEIHFVFYSESIYKKEMLTLCFCVSDVNIRNIRLFVLCFNIIVGGFKTLVIIWTWWHHTGYERLLCC